MNASKFLQDRGLFKLEYDHLWESAKLIPKDFSQQIAGMVTHIKIDYNEALELERDISSFKSTFRLTHKIIHHGNFEDIQNKKGFVTPKSLLIHHHHENIEHINLDKKTCLEVAKLVFSLGQGNVVDGIILKIMEKGGLSATESFELIENLQADGMHETTAKCIYKKLLRKAIISEDYNECSLIAKQAIKNGNALLADSLCSINSNHLKELYARCKKSTIYLMNLSSRYPQVLVELIQKNHPLEYYLMIKPKIEGSKWNFHIYDDIKKTLRKAKGLNEHDMKSFCKGISDEMVRTTYEINPSADLLLNFLKVNSEKEFKAVCSELMKLLPAWAFRSSSTFNNFTRDEGLNFFFSDKEKLIEASFKSENTCLKQLAIDLILAGESGVVRDIPRAEISPDVALRIIESGLDYSFWLFPETVRKNELIMERSFKKTRGNQPEFWHFEKKLGLAVFKGAVKDYFSGLEMPIGLVSVNTDSKIPPIDEIDNLSFLKISDIDEDNIESMTARNCYFTLEKLKKMQPSHCIELVVKAKISDKAKLDLLSRTMAPAEYEHAFSHKKEWNGHIEKVISIDLGL